MQVIHIQTEIAKHGLDLGGVMQFVVDQTMPLLGADGAAIELAEDGEMVYKAASGIAKDQIGLRLKIDDSLTGLCVMTGETLSCDDSETDPRVDRLACREIGLRSMIVMPLKHNELTVGALKAMSVQPGKFDELDVMLLEMLSEVVAASMYFSIKYDSNNLFKRATSDSMTGLSNRALFMSHLRNVVAQLNRGQNPSGVLMIDMDGLKQINDRHGHRTGDAVIIEFASRLKKATRITDTVARLGGDEFGVILSPLEGANGINSALQRIRSEITPPYVFEGNQYQLNASIGFALIPEDGSEPEKILEVADQRMYAIKKLHKSRSD